MSNFFEKELREAAAAYVEPFRARETVRDNMKMVYICAPLRGEIQKNIEFARQKAQEVFQQGHIPICPHLMFPPFADAANPTEDQAARDMGLRLIEACQQVNVYGSEWTDGMRAEIRHAERLGIPVVTDPKTMGKTKSKRRTAKQPER